MWTIKIPNWTPPSMNKARGRHWSKSHKNTTDAAEYLTAYAMKADVPKVTDDYRPRRFVAVDVTKCHPMPDPDNLMKALLDGLKRARLIVDDSDEWCHWEPPTMHKVGKHAPGQGIVIVLHDLTTIKKPVQCELADTAKDIYATLSDIALGSDSADLAGVLWDCAKFLAGHYKPICPATPGPVELLPEVTTGDCGDVLASILASSVDMVFADPPFNIDYTYDLYADNKPRNEYLSWCEGWVRECVRILKPNGSMWVAIGDEYSAELNLIMKRAGLHWRNSVVWSYEFGNYQKRKFGRNHGNLLYFTKHPDQFTFNESAVLVQSARRAKYNDKRTRHAGYTGRVPGDVWAIPRIAGTHKERTDHVCQMPEAVLERIILTSTNAGQLIVDPFAGSGTTLAVARKLGRIGRGVELSPEYAAKIRQRCAAVTQQVAIPDPELL